VAQCIDANGLKHAVHVAQASGILLSLFCNILLLSSTTSQVDFVSAPASATANDTYLPSMPAQPTGAMSVFNQAEATAATAPAAKNPVAQYNSLV
jgi:hypothetical protein